MPNNTTDYSEVLGTIATATERAAEALMRIVDSTGRIADYYDYQRESLRAHNVAKARLDEGMMEMMRAIGKGEDDED